MNAMTSSARDDALLMLTRRAEKSLDAAVALLVLAYPESEDWLAYEPALSQLAVLINDVVDDPAALITTTVPPPIAAQFRGWLYEHLDVLAALPKQDPRIVAAAEVNRKRFDIFAKHPDLYARPLH